jgi:hypothetical protein
MSAQKDRLMITVDYQLRAYAEQLVEEGLSASVSEAFNEAMAEKAYQDKRKRTLWIAKASQADRARVARLWAHVEHQLRR